MSDFEKLRVLHVPPYFPPDRVGGVGEIAKHLHDGLISRGYDSQVLTAGTTETDPRIHRVSGSRWVFALRCWQGTSLARNADIVHFHHGDAILLLIALRLLRIRTRVLVSMHVDNWKMGKSYRSVAGGAVLGWLSSLGRNLNAGAHWASDTFARWLADGEVFFSKSAAQDVLGLEAARQARVIYDGLPEFPTQRGEELPRSSDLLFVGTFSPRKRTDQLPAILKAANAQRPGTTLRLVGASPADEPGLAADFQKFGLAELVAWEGRLLSEDIQPFYEAAGVLLVPSAYEGLPTVILEAMQCGLPCVATRVSGHPEVIEDGRNGFLTAPDQAQEMAEKAVSILEDPSLRLRMSSAARTTVGDRFRLERMVSEYEALYSQMVASKHAEEAQ